MSSDNEARFNVYFAGQCLDGFTEATVRDALGRLFKADAATLERLFSGSRQLIKRDCDRNTALTYQQAMKRVGARPVIAPAGEAPRSAAMPEPPAGAAGIALAPAGSDVLRPEERLRQAPVDIPTDHLRIEPVGERLSPEHEIAATVEAPDFEVAAPGTTLHSPSENVATPAPDTSALSVSDRALDLSDCAPPPAEAPPLDLGHLAVEEGGALLLTEAERQPDPASAPDTSHLSLSEDSDENSGHSGDHAGDRRDRNLGEDPGGTGASRPGGSGN
jgi:hypothetical protein